jgi:phospholipid/cholesterol/gamma-HCH transport system substrate-binding protein
MAKQDLTTELKVGLFTLGGVAVLATLVVILQGNPFGASTQTFYTDVENVGGVGQRTQVRTSGVQVGEVRSIDILDKGARVYFQVEGKVKVPKGSYIELRSRGILGDVYLEIVRTQGVTEWIPSGEAIPQAGEFSDLGSLMKSMGSIAVDIKTVSQSLSEVFGSGEGKRSLKAILANIEDLTGNTADIVKSERQNIEKIIENIRFSTEKVLALIDRNDGRIDQIVNNVRVTIDDVKLFTAELRKFAQGENRARIERVIATLDDSMQNIKLASAKVENIVDKVNKGEGTLGQLISKDDTINEVKQSLKSLQDLLKPATKLKVEVDYRGELRSGETKYVDATGNHFNLRLFTRPDRFYLIGITDSPAAQKVTVTTKYAPTTSGDGTTVREETLVPEDRNRIRLNAQFAKRFDNVGVRFGLFEGSAGVASDLYLFSNSLQTSLEIFNFGDSRLQSSNHGKGFARVKLYSSYFMTPNLYVTLGADNFGKTPKTLGFMGLGLRFTDDDIKAVLGTAAMLR